MNTLSAHDSPWPEAPKQRCSAVRVPKKKLSEKEIPVAVQYAETGGLAHLTCPSCVGHSDVVLSPQLILANTDCCVLLPPTRKVGSEKPFHACVEDPALSRLSNAYSYQLKLRHRVAFSLQRTNANHVFLLHA